MAKNPQTENGHIQIANEIWEEIIRRDFSKRQLAILQLILRLSYGCRKKTATIPKLKDFEVCGVGKTNITQELKYLTTTKVIVWDKEENTFTFNKDYDMWQISPVKGWDEEVFKELLHINLTKKLSKQEPTQETPDKQSYHSNNRKVIKTITTKLSKQELQQSFLAVVSTVREGSKYIIKDIIKKRIKYVSKYDPALDDPIPNRRHNSPFDTYWECYGKFPTGIISKEISTLLKKNMEPDIISYAIIKGAGKGKEWPYVMGHLSKLLVKGILTYEAMEFEESEFQRKRAEIAERNRISQYQPKEVKKDKLPSWIEQQEQEAKQQPAPRREISEEEDNARTLRIQQKLADMQKYRQASGR